MNISSIVVQTVPKYLDEVVKSLKEDVNTLICMVTKNRQTISVILLRHESGDMMDSFHRVACSFWLKSLGVKICPRKILRHSAVLISCVPIKRSICSMSGKRKTGKSRKGPRLRLCLPLAIP